MHNFLIALNWIKVKLEEIGNTSNVAKHSRCELQAKSNCLRFSAGQADSIFLSSELQVTGTKKS